MRRPPPRRARSGEVQPCLAVSDRDEGTALYLNGGVYGGRAAVLEKVLRRFLAKQFLLTERQSSGEAYRKSGRTHQYLWNQFFLDRRDEVALDYGGSFVVNLARRSLAPSQFGLEEDGTAIRSVMFQRPVCVAHSNGAGYADSTLHLLRAALAFRFDTTVCVGVSPEDFDEISMGVPLQADSDRGARVLLDAAMCFPSLASVATWHGTLVTVDLITPEFMSTYQGLELVVLRPSQRPSSNEGAKVGGARVFQVVEVQWTALWKHGPPRENASIFHSRQRFDVTPFRLHMRQGDCVGWRCQGRCDLAYADFSHEEDNFAALTAQGIPRRGVWMGRPRGGIKAGDTLTLGSWKPRAYMMSILAEVTGIGFYEPEDGG
uniref:Uncharacterized protein n=1 Tax=Alexandrium monilatum TaxID=311494 RepID=A0A7S4PSY0_9DINO